MPRLAQQLALAVGVGGAMVDVSTYVRLEDGIKRRLGTDSEFDQVSPGTFSFSLDNGDGRFTPDNTAILATPLAEGAVVCWKVDSQLRSGKVTAISPSFPDDESAWSVVKVTVHDALGDAARRDISGASLSEAMILASPAHLYFPMDDPSGPLREASGNSRAPLVPMSGAINFEVDGVPSIGGKQVEFPGTSVSVSFFQNPGQYQIQYPPTSLGSWGFWYTPLSATAGFDIAWTNGTTILQTQFQFVCSTVAGGMTFQVGGGPVISTSALTVGVPHYFSVTLTTDPGNVPNIYYSLYMDGVLQSTSSHNLSTFSFPFSGPTALFVRTAATRSGRVQHLSHTVGLIDEYATGQVSTEAGWLTTLGLMAADVRMAALPAGLSTRPIGPVDYEGRALLDLIAEVILTEQGYVHTSTTGTLLNPVQRVVVRDRARPAAVSYTFDAERDLQGAPQFVRDTTNMVSSVDVSGPVNSVLATDGSLAARVGSANTSETILSTETVDLLAWGQDRLNRGANIRLRIASLTIDAMTLPTSTATATVAALLAMVPGDRVRITNLPNTQLGFNTWDGWFLGSRETHNLEAHLFELYFQPVLPDTAVYDTNLWMSGGVHALSAGITSSATSMSVSTSDPVTKLETVTFPYTMTLDSEQVMVTACTSATPQVATITRGVNGTTAAAHSAGALVEIIPASLYAF